MIGEEAAKVGLVAKVVGVIMEAVVILE